MKIKIDNIELNVSASDNHSDHSKPSLIFLHGFTGQASDWSDVMDNLHPGVRSYAIDLPGHGQSSSPNDTRYYTAEFLTDLILKTAAELGLDKFVLAGYSMGGRAAFSFASAHPELLTGLIIESSTAGIEESRLRNERICSDESLTEMIRSDGVIKFIDYWYSLPLFESLRQISGFDLIREKRYANNADGLINSLLGFGAGMMPAVWNALIKFDFPVLLINGELDKKYCDIHYRMRGSIKNSEQKIIKECGHAAHLEKPEEFVNFVNEFLVSKIIKD